MLSVLAVSVYVKQGRSTTGSLPDNAAKTAPPLGRQEESMCREFGAAFVSVRHVASIPREVFGKDAQVTEDVQRVLQEIHDELFSKAVAERDANLASIDAWKDFSPNLNKGKMLLVPFCGEKDRRRAVLDLAGLLGQCVRTKSGIRPVWTKLKARNDFPSSRPCGARAARGVRAQHRSVAPDSLRSHSPHA